MSRQSDRPSNARPHRPWIGAVFAASLPIVLGATIASATPVLLDVAHFQFEQQAQEHCPGDSIVWAIARSGIYNSRAERWYGQTRDGTYVCRREAEAAGYHAAGASR